MNSILDDYAAFCMKSIYLSVHRLVVKLFGKLGYCMKGGKPPCLLFTQTLQCTTEDLRSKLRE